MTPERLEEVKAVLARAGTPTTGMVRDLVDEVDRCHEGLRSGAAEHRRVREVFEKAYDAAIAGDLHTVRQLLIEEVEG